MMPPYFSDIFIILSFATLPSPPPKKKNQKTKKQKKTLYILALHLSMLSLPFQVLEYALPFVLNTLSHSAVSIL